MNSIDKHGINLVYLTRKAIGAQIYAIPENYATICGLLTLPTFTVVSFWIEILAAEKTNRSLIFGLVFLNQFALWVFPLWLSFTHKTNPMFGGILLVWTVALSMKLVSFHHVMHDVRGLVLRTIKAKKEGSELKPSLIEGTVLGVNKDIYEIAMTYPNCLTLRDFTRFLLCPSLVY